MAIADGLTHSFQHEMATTRKVLAAVPDASFNWRPHPKSMTAGVLAAHVAEIPLWSQSILREGFYDLAVIEPRQHPKTVAEILQSFDACVATAAKLLAATTDEQFHEPWSLKSGSNVFFTMPRIAVTHTWIFNHLIHHRGQLSVYLRLLDVPVPQIYGPSADFPSM